MPDEKTTMRAVITYRTKALGEKEKWSAWREREIEAAADSQDAMKQFWTRWFWSAMTGSVEVKSVEWPDAV